MNPILNIQLKRKKNYKPTLMNRKEAYKFLMNCLTNRLHPAVTISGCSHPCIKLVCNGTEVLKSNTTKTSEHQFSYDTTLFT